MVKGYCLNCTERYLGCHSKCEKYKKYKKELAEYNNKVKIEKQMYNRIRKRIKMFK